MIREFHQTSLRRRNSFGVEQHAARLVEFETEEDLHAIFGGGIPDRWSVLSGGNNILFTQDYDGLLLTPVSQRIALLSEEGGTVHVRADAGAEWDDLVEWAVQRGLWGLENLSLIPGKAGAAPRAEHRRLRLRGEGRDRAGTHVLRGKLQMHDARRRALLFRLPRKHLQARPAGTCRHHGGGHPPFAYAATPAGVRRRGARSRIPRRHDAAQHPRGNLRHPPRPNYPTRR